ncbi:MAG: hypothetical protein CVV25_08575 [Ignavibacteriae bacterium HGW-Ignavibacteriae-4]|nr:MAG: hypothetical protein CVV25_08575 [Ignavibacteriae bacterium HGW-Ignavibacteriae-4]
MIKYFRIIFMVTLIFGVQVKLFSQIHINKDIDIINEISAGNINVSIYPESLNSEINKLFDGQPFTEFGINDDDSIEVTISFKDPTRIFKSKTFFMIYGGQWSLATANNLEDLKTKKNSFKAWVTDKPYNGFQWDSTSLNNEEVSFIKLTARNLSAKIVHLGEWKIQIEKTLVSLVIKPDLPRLLPGTHLTLKVGMLDEFNNYYDYNLGESLVWSSENSNVASFEDEFSVLTGKTLGTTIVSVRTASNKLSGNSVVSVVNDFEAEKADKITVKVAVVYQDPMVTMGTRLHTKFNWFDPKPMVQQLVDEYNTFSGGVIDFKIVEVHDDQFLFTRLDSTYMTTNQLVTYFNEPGWATIKSLAEKENRIKFDYKAMIEYYDFYNKRQKGDIDEVWVYTFPFGGMYESQLVGKEAIWWNSPPIKDVPADFTKLISVMGWNYERTVDLAMHSFGHRMESAVRAAYGRWDVHNANPNGWEIFTSIDKELGNRAHIGNIHFPPNGTSDYDYENTRVVKTFAKNWKRYPNLLDQYDMVSCSEWNCNQLGYMRWWFSHIPRFKGITDGVLNNWWHYFVDYQGAIKLAANSPVVSVKDEVNSAIPEKFHLNQNYPNPFNPTTTISFELQTAGSVTLTIYNSLGQKVESLLNNSELSAGIYQTQWEPKVASGIYFCRISTNDKNNSTSNNSNIIKMMFLK